MMIVLSREFREKFKFRRNDMSWQRQLLKILDIWIFSSRLFASLISLIESHRLPFSIFCIMSASFVMKWAIQLLFVWKQQRIYNSWEKKLIRRFRLLRSIFCYTLRPGELLYLMLGDIRQFLLSHGDQTTQASQTFEYADVNKRTTSATTKQLSNKIGKSS